MKPTEAQKARLQAQFGARVRKQRDSLGLTQEDLAERTGLHFTYVGSVERGKRNISLVNIVRIAKGLDSDPGKMLRGLRL